MAFAALGGLLLWLCLAGDRETQQAAGPGPNAGGATGKTNLSSKDTVKTGKPPAPDPQPKAKDPAVAPGDFVGPPRPPRDDAPPKKGVPPPKDDEPPPKEEPLSVQVERLLKAVQSTVKADQLAAMKELGNLGTAGKAAVPLFSEMLRDTSKEHFELGEQAARSLAQIGWPAVPELIKALDDPSAVVKARALWAIAVIGPDAAEALPALAAALQDKDAKLRGLAAQALAELGPAARPAIPALVRALEDADPQVRLLAAEALHEIGEETVEHLLEAVRHKDAAIRVTAVQSLVTFHESRPAVTALVEALKDPDRKVRAAAAGALVRLGPTAKAAIAGLLENLREDDLELQSQALTALLAIAAPDDVKLLEQLAELNGKYSWADPPGGSAKPNNKDLIKALLPALDDPNPTRRLGAVLALGRLGGDAKEALPRLRLLLDRDRNRCVLAAALLVTGALDPKQKAEGKTAEVLLKEVWTDLKPAKKRDVEELLQLYLLTSTLANPKWSPLTKDARLQKTAEEARAWSAQAVDELAYSQWTLPALVRGLNVTAEFQLGYTEPFARLSMKFASLVKGAKDLQPLSYAFTQLGAGVPRGALLAPALENDRAPFFTNVAFLDLMITIKQQDLAAKVNGQKSKMEWYVYLRSMTHFSLNGGCQTRFGVFPSGRGQVGPEVATQGQLELQALIALKLRTESSLEELARTFWTYSDTALVDKLEDKDPKFRWLAATIVGRKRIHAEKELIDLLADPSPEVREVAHQALVRLARGSDFGPLPGPTNTKIQSAIKGWSGWLKRQQPPVERRPPASHRPKLNPMVGRAFLPYVKHTD
jgi:HEAT repeat protein